MSDTQAKATPSKAARELAEKCRNLSAPYDYATLIQAELRDLLEKAEAFRAQNYNSIGAKALKSALEPWKPGE